MVTYIKEPVAAQPNLEQRMRAGTTEDLNVRGRFRTDSGLGMPGLWTQPTATVIKEPVSIQESAPASHVYVQPATVASRRPSEGIAEMVQGGRRASGVGTMGYRGRLRTSSNVGMPMPSYTSYARTCAAPVAEEFSLPVPAVASATAPQ
eukprot:1864917-Amphidinium_carterae.1